MEQTLLYNTFNRFCKYLEKNRCSRIFSIERDNIVFRLNNKIFPTNIGRHSFNWFIGMKTLDIQTQLKHFLLPLNDQFSSIFMDVHNFPHSCLPKDITSLISVFGIPTSLEEINMKLDLYGA